ncbi:hypothetical protein F5B20DRAFT_533407 [Whalleya microplaca]|nr:hypothetical protein F5B20DRAFT_533407 [Whalleya microplaca]
MVADFSMLQELDIQLRSLIGNRRNIRFVQLEKKLPVSLQKLVIRNEYWKNDQLEFEDIRPGVEEARLRDMVRRFARDGKRRCTKLERFYLGIEPEVGEDGMEAFTAEFPRLFAEVKVEFRVFDNSSLSNHRFCNPVLSHETGFPNLRIVEDETTE